MTRLWGGMDFLREVLTNTDLWVIFDRFGSAVPTEKLLCLRVYTVLKQGHCSGDKPKKRLLFFPLVDSRPVPPPPPMIWLLHFHHVAAAAGGKCSKSPWAACSRGAGSCLHTVWRWLKRCVRAEQPVRWRDSVWLCNALSSSHSPPPSLSSLSPLSPSSTTRLCCCRSATGFIWAVTTCSTNTSD